MSCVGRCDKAKNKRHPKFPLTSTVVSHDKGRNIFNIEGNRELTTGVRSEKTITRQELAEAVYAVVSLPRKEAAELVGQVLDEICDALVRDGEVKITNFGTLKVSSKAERVGRNPKTGEAAIIPSRRVIMFKAAAGMKKMINGGDDEAVD
jgi:integration host factor subunit alpha